MTDDLVGRLQGLLAKATPAPWKCVGGDVFDAEDGLVVSLTNAWKRSKVQRQRDEADPKLIAEGITALPTLLARIEALEAENGDLKQSVIAFGAPWAVQYAKQAGMPDGHLHATHYDILAAAGARMDAFTRHEDRPHAD